MTLIVGIAIVLAFGLVLDYFGGVVRALAEIYTAAASPLPLALTVVAAIGIGYLGVELWSAARSDGEHLAGAALVGVGSLLAMASGAVWREARNARLPDHEPRG